MAPPQRRAKPPSLPTVFENSSASSRPKYNATSPEELSLFVKSESDRHSTGLSRSQYKALSRCYPTATGLAIVEAKKPFLNDMLSTFDDLLFGSTVAARTSLKFCDTRKSMFNRTLGEMSPSGNHVTIEIYKLLAIGVAKSHTERLWHYAGTLLHEIVHVYTDLYISHDHERKARPLAVRGDTGHGFLWHDVAYVVETAFNAMTGAKIDIGRQGALCRELSHWPKVEWSDVDTIGRWGLKPECKRDRISRKFSEVRELVRKTCKK